MSRAREILKGYGIKPSSNPKIRAWTKQMDSIENAVIRSMKGTATSEDTMLILQNSEMAKLLEEQIRAKNTQL